ERFECRALEPQAKIGDAAFEKFLVTQRCPIGSLHLAHGITAGNAVTPSRESIAGITGGFRSTLQPFFRGSPTLIASLGFNLWSTGTYHVPDARSSFFLNFGRRAL